MFPIPERPSLPRRYPIKVTCIWRMETRGGWYQWTAEVRELDLIARLKSKVGPHGMEIQANMFRDRLRDDLVDQWRSRHFPDGDERAHDDAEGHGDGHGEAGGPDHR